MIHKITFLKEYYILSEKCPVLLDQSNTATVFNLNTNTDKELDADIEYSTFFETDSSQGIADIQLSIREKNRLLLGDVQTGTLFISCGLVR